MKSTLNCLILFVLLGLVGETAMAQLEIPIQMAQFADGKLELDYSGQETGLNAGGKTFDVQIPYTEHVTQTYQVQVPFTETITDDEGNEKTVERVRVETRTRVIPVTRMRTEKRNRIVPANGRVSASRIKIQIIGNAKVKFRRLDGSEVTENELTSELSNLTPILKIADETELSDLHRAILRPDLMVLIVPEDVEKAILESNETDPKQLDEHGNRK